MEKKTDKERLSDAETIIRQKHSTIIGLERELRASRQAYDAREKLHGAYDPNPKAPAWLMKPEPAHAPGVPMLFLSDFHWGETVFEEQVGGANKFNRKIAIARLKRCIQIHLDLCFEHMVHPDYPGMVLLLGGDLITGNIHEELKYTNEGPLNETLLEVQSELTSAIKTLAKHFKKIFIPCVVGNHGRMSIKPQAKHAVKDNYEWKIYNDVATLLAGTPGVQFHVSDEADAYFAVQGHRFLLTHGDNLGVKGGDGIIGAIGPIARGDVKVGKQARALGRDYDTLLIGHWHSYQPRGDLCRVVVNGALKGYDEYAALKLRVPPARPSQALWFIHPKHGFTAQWPIYLDGRPSERRKVEWLTWEKVHAS